MNKNVYVQDGELNIDRAGFCYRMQNSKRTLQALNMDLEAQLINDEEYKKAVELLMMDNKKVAVAACYYKPFNKAELLKTIEEFQKIRVPILMKINDKTYSKLKQTSTLVDKLNAEMSMFSLKFEVDDDVTDNKAKIIYNNGDEEIISVFK